MKGLRKINKGLILTILVFIIFITYVVITEIRRNEEKGLIKQVCEQYIDFENKYTVIPKEYRTKNGEVEKEKLEQYKKELFSELKKIMIGDENIYKQQENIIKDKLKEQENALDIYTNKESKMIKITKYEFDADQVVVTIENIVEFQSITLANENNNINLEEENINKSNQKFDDTITLKRENGEWKIVFADIETLHTESNFIF